MRKSDRSKKTKVEEVQGGIKSREVVGILLLGLSVFAILALYVDATGQVGGQLRSILRMCFGDLAVLFTLLFFLLSLHVFRGRKWPPSFQRSLGLILLVASITLVFHMLYYRGYQFPPNLMEEIRYAQRGEGAGILGAVLLVGSYNAFGIHGSYVLVITMVLLGLIFLFKISLTDLARSGAKYVWTAICRFWHGQVDGYREWRDERKRQRLHRKEQITPEEPMEAVLLQEPKKSTKAKRQTAKEKGEPEVSKESPVEPEQLVLNLPKNDELGAFALPPTYLLKKSGSRAKKTEGVQTELLEDTLASFGIEAKVVNVSQGPVVTRYELQPAPGIKVSRITALADDLALALAAEDVRIEAPVPGKPVVGIEVPNKTTESVLLRDVLESPELLEHPSPVALALGKDIAGKPVIADLKKWLHVLVAGSTGSGKSVCLNAMISSILFRASPEVVKLLMVDPKRVELSGYDGIPHLISPVVTDPKKAAIALRWAVGEMERRYELFANAGVRNIDMYLDAAKDSSPEEPMEHLPYIVVIVDELADLMMVAAAEVEDAICRLAQMARAAGMYLIIATQRPSVDVITGLIKANVPSRISFAVSSQVDSRTILDMGGAERLIGKGDMLYYPIGASKPVRAQGAWISDKEVESLVEYWRKQGEPEYKEDVVEAKVEDFTLSDDEEDELLPDAIRLVVENGQASISMLQRRFRIGYSRAARLIDVMEVRGIVGSYQGSKPREVLADSTILEEG
ncbi:MAG TPA: DNA translocase FtsK 4TM domain-containing protein [Limnochordia bacterium]|nr:DNA translocase FtsK 4TM domain-containing protein [Limnochordia bacterium]